MCLVLRVNCYPLIVERGVYILGDDRLKRQFRAFPIVLEAKTVVALIIREYTRYREVVSHPFSLCPRLGEVEGNVTGISVNNRISPLVLAAANGVLLRVGN